MCATTNYNGIVGLAPMEFSYYISSFFRSSRRMCITC